MIHLSGDLRVFWGLEWMVVKWILHHLSGEVHCLLESDG